MTPTALRRLLRQRASTQALEQQDPDTVLRHLEALAEDDPHDPWLQARVRDAWTLARARESLPPLVAGVRHETLVRWDGWTLTLMGVDTASGITVMVRVLRPGFRDATHARALAREGRALAALPGWPGAYRDDPEVALVAAASDAPLLDGGTSRPVNALRAMMRVVADLARREQVGLPPLDPDHHEIVQSEDGAGVISLTAWTDDQPDLAELAARLLELSPGDGPTDEVMEGAMAVSPGSAADWSERLTAALAEDLASRRHTLALAFRNQQHSLRRAHLRALVSRLGAVPPPAGRGVVGIDLEGQPTLVSSDGDTLEWGPEDGPRLAICSRQGLHPRTARRLLRARASAPANPRLDAQLGTDPAYADRACRWVAAALTLRTVARLLETPAP